MIIEGLGGRMLVVSVSDPRYALHSAKLYDGRILEIKEDLRQTAEFRHMAASRGDFIPPSPRYYVTGVVLPSGGRVNPKEASLPAAFRLNGGGTVDSYVCNDPKDN